MFVCTNVSMFLCNAMARSNQVDGLLILRVLGSNGNQHTERFVHILTVPSVPSPPCQHDTSWFMDFGNLTRIGNVARQSGCAKQAR